MKLSLKKKLALEAYRLYRHNEIKAHPLTYFFWECTLRCNLHCLHCGSDCVKDAIPDMPREDFMNVLDKLAPHIDPKHFIVTPDAPGPRRMRYGNQEARLPLGHGF